MDEKLYNIKEDIKKLVQSFAEEGKYFSSVRLEDVFDDLNVEGYVLVLEAEWFSTLTGWDALTVITGRLYELRDKGLISNDTLRAIDAVRTDLPKKRETMPLIIYP